jgi:hypothetical protein
LTYAVGSTPDAEIHLRIAANTGSGAISANWIPFRAIRDVLKGVPPGELTSSHLQPLYAGKSVNTPGFLLAALMSEGLVRPSTSKRRCYECVEAAMFEAAVNAWRTAGAEKADGTGARGKVKKGTSTKVVHPTEASKVVLPKAVENETPNATQGVPPETVKAAPLSPVSKDSTKARKSAPRKAAAKRHH